MAKGPAVITDADFEAEVLGSSQPVLVDFWAAWCAPCRMVAPLVAELAVELNGRVKVVKLDVDSNPETPSRLGVMSIPTLILFKDGQPVERTVGYRPDLKRVLREKLEGLL